LSAPPEESDNLVAKDHKDPSAEADQEDVDPFSSSQGAWITLELYDGGFQPPPPPTPQKDGLLSKLKDFLLDNYQLRVVWPANVSGFIFTGRTKLGLKLQLSSFSSQFPIDVTISIHTPSSMLSLGSVVWQTEEDRQSAFIGPAPTHMVEPKSKSKIKTEPTSKASPESDSDVKLNSEAKKCSVVYAHIAAKSHSLRIPSSSSSLNSSSSFYASPKDLLLKYLDLLSSHLYSPLGLPYHPSCASSQIQAKLKEAGSVEGPGIITSAASSSRPTSMPNSKPQIKSQSGAKKEEDFKCTGNLLVPLHLKLEHFYFGAIPETALDLLILLLPVLSIAFVFVLPRVRSGIEEVLREGEMKEKTE